MYLPEPLTGKVVGFRSEFEVGPGAGRQPTGGAGAAGGSHPTSIIVPSILSLEASSRKESSGWLPVGSGEIVWAPTLGRLWADSGPNLGRLSPLSAGMTCESQEVRELGQWRVEDQPISRIAPNL